MSSRKGPKGRREIWYEGGWVPEAELTPEQLRQAMAPPAVEESTEPVRTMDPDGPTAAPRRTATRKGPRGTPQVCIRGTWISQKVADTWDAWIELRDARAVAGRVGIVASDISAYLRRYEEVFGVKRPPARKADKAPATQSQRFESGHKPRPWEPPLASLSESSEASEALPADKPSGGPAPKHPAKRKTTRPAHASDAVSRSAPAPEQTTGIRKQRGGDGPARAREVLDDALHQLEARIRARLDEPPEAQPAPRPWRDDAQVDGYLVVSIDATIPTAELASWEPDRIRALFAGIAAVRDAIGEAGP